RSSKWKSVKSLEIKRLDICCRKTCRITSRSTLDISCVIPLLANNVELTIYVFLSETEPQEFNFVRLKRKEALKLVHQQNPHIPDATRSFDTSPTGFDDSKHQLRSINGMPSSCGDLQMLGHTLNGLYSIRGLREVETVYCDFNKPLNDPGFQTRIGYQNIKTRPVYFNVRKTKKFSTENTPIPFDRAILNDGGAMNLETGIFTAPVAGIYFFSFTGLVQFEVTSAGSLSALWIMLYRNNQLVARSQINEVNPVTNPNYLSPITFQSTLKLNATDEVWVEIKRDIVFGVLFDDGDTYCTNFNGWLLEEEI
ncbi:EMILIN-1-like, partial [Daphnia carinata]|uniref:EMILIN-1-like n=1 Tax=Daphnia carinata TaxID=120202 RepID=UPI002868BF02